MQTMLTFAETDFSVLRRRVAACERVGISAVGVGDSPKNIDAFVALAAIAEHTSSVRIGPVVTNLVTRPAAAVARAISSIDRLAGGGRAFLGLGAGDSALLGTGSRPKGVEGFRQGIRDVRDSWSDASHQNGRIVVAANGPLTLRMAMAEADVVISGTGVDDPSVNAVMDIARDVERTTGRVAEIWILARVSILENKEQALEELRPLMAADANHLFASKHERSRLDPTIGRAIDTLRARYDYSAHGQRYDNPNSSLIDELGLREFLAARLAIAGPGPDVASRFSQLSDLGISGIAIPAIGMDADRLIENVGEILK